MLYRYCFSIFLEYNIRTVQEYEDRMKLNGTKYQLMTSIIGQKYKYIKKQGSSIRC